MAFKFRPLWSKFRAVGRDGRSQIGILEGTFGILVRGRVLNRRQGVYVSVRVFVIDSSPHTPCDVGKKMCDWRIVSRADF